MDVGAWLRGLGLERYEEAFRDNDVDAEVLPELTADDLTGLGVTSVGHRRKLLAAIAALRAGLVPSAATSPVAEPAPDGPPAARSAGAERRQLTVLFADLVGSTELSSRLDPEDMREVLRAYQNTVTGEIARFEGHVAKFLGDGVLAYFGWPRADEDDAERAVRAGLAVTEAVDHLPTPAGGPLAVRVGIATGLVVVGDLVGEGAAREEAVVGETPNLAARLQGAAAPGTVVIADGTRRLLGKVFELRELGSTRLKGFARPVAGFEVLGERPAGSRFEARRPGLPPPMVGRDQELALVLERWWQAAAGEGQAVLLVGEAGIGKSRLVRAVLDTVAGEEHTALRYQCSPYHTGTALWPVARQLAFAAGLEPGDPEATRLDKLEALLRQGVEDLGEAAPLIAALLGIDADARYPARDLTPQQRRRRTLAALAAQPLGLARLRPVLMVLEDAHWIDPTTLELVGLALDRVADARVLMLLTTRPDGQPALGGHPHVTRLTLNRLGRGPTEAIVARLAGERGLPPKVRGEIAARTDGVPLFVEELTKAVLEAGARGAGTVVPVSLHASLMARLDRVPGVKEVAQVAACLGREFSYPLLAAVSPLPEPGLRAALDRLAAAELVFGRGEPPEASYTFKHALVRDAAHEGLLRAERQRLHARIARVLEERFPETADAEPELLAHHCSAAGLAQQAIGYWDKAARRAIERSGSIEAVGHLRRALDLLVDMPASRERDRTELRLQTSLGAQFAVTRGYAAPDVEEAFGRARALCQALDDAPELPPVLFGLWRYYLARARYPESREMGEQCLALAERARDASLILEANHALSWTLMAQGQLDRAREHIETTLRLYEPQAHRALAFVYGTDPGPHSRALLSWQLWLLGWPDRALAASDRALAEAEAHGHKVTLGVCQFYAAKVHEFRREPQRVMEVAEAGMATCREQGLGFYLALLTIMNGWAQAQRGDAGAIPSIREGLDAYLKTGALVLTPYLRAKLADAYRASGRLEEALKLIDEALSVAGRNDERWFEADLHRCRGELVQLIDPGAEAEAEACFRQALDVARHVEARSLELRAATSLARLWRGQDRRAEARDLLALVYGWFTEGFDTKDLREAEALLEVLH